MYSDSVITLGEAIYETKKMYIEKTVVGQRVVVGGEIFVIDKSNDTPDGWMLWLDGGNKSMWYTQTLITVISEDVMLPRQLDAYGCPISKYLRSM